MYKPCQNYMCEFRDVNRSTNCRNGMNGQGVLSECDYYMLQLKIEKDIKIYKKEIGELKSLSLRTTDTKEYSKNILLRQDNEDLRVRIIFLEDRIKVQSTEITRIKTKLSGVKKKSINYMKGISRLKNRNNEKSY